MKRILNNNALLFIAAVMLMVIAPGKAGVINGQTTKETRKVGTFTGVSLAFSGDIFIKQGSPQSVEIEAEQKTLAVIESELEGSTLVLKTKNGNWRDLGKITVYITMPEIDNLSVSGSGDIICQSLVKTDEIDLKISGSGSIKMQDLSVREIDAVVTGSGDIMLSGAGSPSGEMSATITGSGSIRAEGMPVAEVQVTITGSGSASVHATKELETNITGSGSVLYKGNPLVNANATGSGRTRSIN